VFRDGARQVLTNMLEIVDHVVLDATANAFEELVLDTFLGKGADAAAKRATLLKLAPGDWRLKDRWPWVRVAGETEEQILELLYEGVVPLLWVEFPRSRWTGAEKTFSDIGLPVCVHDVELGVMRESRAQLGEPSEISHDDAPALVDAGALIPHAAGDAAGHGGPEHPLSAADLDADVAAVAARAPAANADAAPGQLDFKNLPKKNQEHRTNSLRWLFTNPGQRGN
jgi:hypothetical protein